MKAIMRRFTEYILPEIMLSIIFSAIFNLEILPSYRYVVFIVLTVLFIIYLLAHWFMLRLCFFSISNPKLYFKFNLIAYVAFAVLSIAFYFVLPNTVFTWTFGLTKIFRFAFWRISIPISLILFHIVNIIMIFIAPIGMPIAAVIPEDTIRKAPQNNSTQQKN